MTDIDVTSSYVIDAGGDDVVIKVGQRSLIVDLVSLGFAETAEGLVRKKAASEPEKAELLSKVRDIGLAFSVGPGWSPSAVFEELRDRKLVHGTYRRISWAGPGRPIVDER